MARQKRKKKRTKTQYVRTNKRKAEASSVARRSFSIVILLLLLGSVIFGVAQGFSWVGRKLFSENPRFEVQNLVISSDGRLSEDLIREYTALREGTNLFAVAFEDVETALLRFSGIESVYLERKLPNTLVVKVKERVAVARIRGVEQTRYPCLTDRHGVLVPYRRSLALLPLIQGLDEELRTGMKLEHQDVEISLKILALIGSSPYVSRHVQVESMDVKYSDFIDMRLKGGTRVRMPRFSLAPKLQNLATIIKIATGQGRRVKEVDLTLDAPKVPVTYY